MLTEASVSAGISLREIDQTCIGLAGLTIEAVREWAERELSKVVGGNLLLAGDDEIALDAAFRGGPGILIIAGTGSNVLGRAADGAMYHAGGWVPHLATRAQVSGSGRKPSAPASGPQIVTSQRPCLLKSESSGEQNLLARSSRRPMHAPAPIFPRLFPTSFVALIPAMN